MPTGIRDTKAATGNRSDYLVRKARQFAHRFILRPVGILLHPLLYVALTSISRGRPVRLGTLNAKGRISIMISKIEPNVRRLRAEPLKNPLVIVLNPGPCPNEQLTLMYGRAVWLVDGTRPWLRRVLTVVHHLLIAADSSMAVRLRAGVRHEFARAWRDGTPVLRFTAEEQKAGEELLRSLGVPEGASHICFTVRDDAYYEQLRRQEDSRRINDQAGKEYAIRNPSVGSYLPMAIECATNGHHVLRMGSVVAEPLPAGLHPRIVDYASTRRTPFGDVYLLATCKFAVSGAAGMFWFSTAFNRPVVFTDSYYLAFRPVRPGDLFIPIKFWLIAEKRFLTFREMLGDTDYQWASELHIHRLGLELVRNTPEEIAAVVREMEQRLNGTWRTTEDDEELQRRFQALLTPEHMGYGMPSRIGAQFLRENAHLIGKD